MQNKGNAVCVGAERTTVSDLLISAKLICTKIDRFLEFS